ncbi:tRNA 5-hydroxyuridine modification protein YegQ [Aliiglaciecola sp. CAU 1673]|uniref:prephenate-dependent tRNA uridine(34) hydroxylase TrhP n=1 Tax=Aliiglaciecola sp. CAU 1673 TaxID=3032595 RepID=UPI0023DA3979|nr:tRNA 5-hydroxyuridine modification protein YegQ [Aliiglaciecola sp. CAU 1673]MDF2177029.1 tRNA 5-hydroxyuridine modification protein YegQ [Aliiglaciecola sp. CAU 1673]
MFAPELLSPAGSLKSMRYAFAYGADAVYAGLPRYSLRVRNNGFDLATLAEGIAEAKSLGKKFYVVLNIAPHNAKLKTFVEDVRAIAALKPHAFIVSDPGVIMLLKEHFAHIPQHLSVQANTLNWAAVKFWQQQGIERVILSRELALDEIEQIRTKVPQMELEVFVHGALCMAYSGRCLLSGYMDKRDPNQGACNNACRWQYSVSDAKESTCGELQTSCQQSKVAILTENQRPDSPMPMYEDEHGTYILNSKDLRAIQHVERLTKAGVHSLKIEGRTKSHYYVARTAQLYRRAIDDAKAGKPFDMSLLWELEGLASRGYTEGFLRRHIPVSEMQNYEQGASLSDIQQFVGEMLGRDEKTGLCEVEVKNRFCVGDDVMLMTTKGNRHWRLDALWDKSGNAISVAPGAGHRVYMSLPSDVALEHALLVRCDQQDLGYAVA